MGTHRLNSIVTQAFTGSQRGSETPTETSGFYRSRGVTLDDSGVAPHLLPASENNGDGVSGGCKGAKPPGYLDYYANVVQGVTKQAGQASCPGYFVVGECANGHRFAKELLCGKEWCPTCGKDDSKMHLRRFARWLPKLYQCRSIGYFVFTMPEDVRVNFRTKDKLNYLTKRVTGGDKSNHIEGLLKSLGFTRGFARWHWFGDKSNRYNPHLNVIVESGRISPKVLNQVKVAWASALGVDKAVVNYTFTRKPAKMVHILKYVTRATFRELAWDDRLAANLWNFRNMRSWGNWHDAPVWLLKGNPKFEHIVQLEKGLCPECGSKLTWGKAIPIAWLKYESARDLTSGYWLLDTT